MFVSTINEKVSFAMETSCAFIHLWWRRPKLPIMSANHAVQMLHEASRLWLHCRKLTIVTYFRVSNCIKQCDGNAPVEFPSNKCIYLLVLGCPSPSNQSSFGWREHVINADRESVPQDHGLNTISAHLIGSFCCTKTNKETISNSFWNENCLTVWMLIGFNLHIRPDHSIRANELSLIENSAG